MVFIKKCGKAEYQIITEYASSIYSSDAALNLKEFQIGLYRIIEAACKWFLDNLSIALYLEDKLTGVEWFFP